MTNPNPPIGPEDSDEHAFRSLLGQAQAGEPEAVEAIFERFYPRVRAAVHRDLAFDVRHGRPWLARRFSTGDIVQEVFRGLLKDLSSFRGTTDRALMGYLSMMARNRLLDAVRTHEAAQRDGRRTADVEVTEDSRLIDEDPSHQAARKEEVQRFLGCLEDFDERERLLVRERLEHDTRFSDLAPQLGYSSVSAAKRAFYACQAKILLKLSESSEEGGSQ